MTTARYLGVDLAWREDRADLPANETGVAAIDARGQILDAGWRRGVDEALAWADAVSNGEDAVMFVDAPLVVRNETGQRLCETQVGQRYGRWKVSANSTNLGLPRPSEYRHPRACASAKNLTPASRGRPRLVLLALTFHRP